MILFKNRITIKRVSPEMLDEIIERRTPNGHFLAKEGRKWVAVDNSTGDAWTEEFSRERQAIRWLRGEFEVDEPALPTIIYGGRHENTSIYSQLERP